MDQSKAAGAGAADQPNRTYEDFEPLCKWHRRDNIVEVHLHGFKMEQMRVQTNSAGMLTISGERPLDKAASTWSRFHKEIKLAEDCDIKRVAAKFLAGVLTVTMPRQPKNDQASNNNIAAKSTSLKALMSGKDVGDQDNNTAAAAAANNENATLLLDEAVKSRSSELGQITNLTFKSRLRVAVLVVVTAVVIVIGFGVRGIYIHRSNIRTEEGTGW